ncbi:MAG: pyridoxal phosphate-dependent aminotransferase [Rickettsiales bacterium]|nr:pyridoxal phosphate-dependent aminotransferase [Rickettsiales bacterium]
MDIIAEKLNKIKPSPTIAVTMKAKELKASGKNVIGLGAGEPDFDTADNVKKAAIDAINNGYTGYTAVDGIIELKEAIKNKFKQQNNLDYKTSEIIASVGGKQVIYNALMASLNPGDEVIIPAPFWVSYPDITLLCGGVPKIVNCSEANKFKLTASQLEDAITEKTKWLIINSPSNPTGSSYTEDELKELVSIIEKHPNIMVMSDDIYEHICYDGFTFNTIATIAPKLKERILTINGVSKAYAMTGWRIGYAAGPEKLIKAMAKVQSQSTSNPTSIAQYAAVEALNGTQQYVKDRCVAFQKRRDMVLDMIDDIDGISSIKPEGAFYIFASCKDLIGKKTESGELINNSNDFASYLLEDALVAVVPGIAFGMEDYFRISYATSENDLTEAFKRIKQSCEKLK